MTPVDGEQSINTNNKPGQDTQHKTWWPLWLLGGLVLLFLIIVILLRGLCTDVWYINLLRLNDKLCQSSDISSDQTTRPGLSLEGNSLSINGGNTVILPVKEGSKGEIGSTGTAGIKGSTGATGATGPAGPTDPCVTSGTYFCQGGNNYGTLAVLGTNDVQDLEVVTAGQSSQVIDIQGNILSTRIAELAVLPGVAFVGSFGNEVKEMTFFTPGVSSFSNSSGNNLMVEASTITDSNYNIGWVTNASITDAQANLGFFSDGTVVQSGFGLVGQFVGSNLTSSSNLMGSFDSSTVTSTTSVLAQLSNSTLNTVQNSIVYLTGGSLSATQNSLINVNGGGGTLAGISYSVVVGQSNLNVTNAFESTIFGSFNTITDLTSSAVLGTQNVITNNDRISVNGIGVNMSNSGNTSLVGFVVDAADVDWSNINAFSSDLNNVNWSNIRANSSSLTDVQHFSGYSQGGTVINGLQEGHANFSSSTINNAGALNGQFTLANIDNSDHLFGGFGGYCDGQLPNDPPFGCNLGYNIQFDVDDSNGIVGNVRWVDVYNSNNSFIQAHSSDPLIFSGTIDTVNSGVITVRDSDISNTSYTNVSGNELTVNSTLAVTSNYNSIIGANSVLSGITGSDLIVSNASITDSALINGAVDSSTMSNVIGFNGVARSGSAVTGFGINGYISNSNVNGNNILGAVTDSTVLGTGNVMGLISGGSLVNSSTNVLLNIDNSSIDQVVSSLVSGSGVDIQNTDGSILLGSNNNIDGLTSSILLGNNVSISDPGIGGFDYSFIGTDSVGSINTRINNKGDDSWLNLGGGNVGVGINTPTNKLDVTDTSDDTPASFTGTSGTCTVNTLGGTLSCVSDERLKTNILSLDKGLEAVLALRGVTYNWKSSPDGQAVAGFIAQEVEAILPNLVTELQDGTKSLDKTGMIPYIIEAIKTQDGKLEGINTQLAEQGLKLDSLSEELKILAGRVDQHDADIKELRDEVSELKKIIKDNSVQPTVTSQP